MLTPADLRGRVVPVVVRRQVSNRTPPPRVAAMAILTHAVRPIGHRIGITGGRCHSQDPQLQHARQFEYARVGKSPGSFPGIASRPARPVHPFRADARAGPWQDHLTVSRSE